MYTENYMKEKENDLQIRVGMLNDLVFCTLISLLIFCTHILLSCLSISFSLCLCFVIFVANKGNHHAGKRDTRVYRIAYMSSLLLIYIFFPRRCRLSIACRPWVVSLNILR